jgi:peptidyl-prolyl cis-trans isomerase D
MLVWVRRLLENWIARGFFALLVAVFVFWGISNVVTLIGSDTAVAHVAGRAIDISEVQAAYQTALNQAEQQGGGQPAAGQREQIAQDALASVLRQAVLGAAENKLGITAPDSAIHQAILGIPAFQVGGQFSESQFEQVLQQNGTTPAKFLTQVGDDIADRQLLTAVVAGAVPPAPLVGQIFDYIAEQRTAETVNFPLAAEPAPKPPAAAVLQRFWRDHPADFTAPEYRTIKLVILSPALLAPRESIPQADVDAAYARVVAEQPPVVALRGADVILAGDLAAASRLQAAWAKGADWAAMQTLAKKFNATPIELPATTQAGVPSPALGAAMFAAAPDKVTGPVAGPGGMFIFKVTSVSQSGPDPATVKAQILQQLQLQKAQAEVAQDVDSLQDALAGQTPLDRLPGNLGLVAVQGTLDAKGNTPDGGSAPIPGDDALKTAILQAAFAAHPGDPAQLTNGPEGSYFALTVDKLSPPALQPYDQVAAKVLSAWTKDEISREAETKAAALLGAVTSGKTLDEAASAAGDSVSVTAPFTRGSQPAGMPAAMAATLFTLTPGQATMAQTDDGFMVAGLERVTHPAQAQDPADVTQLQQSLVKALQTDVGQSFLAGLQKQDQLSVNQKLLAQLYN